MVAEALILERGRRALNEYHRSQLFWAAVFHDIGEPAATRLDEGGASPRGVTLGLAPRLHGASSGALAGSGKTSSGTRPT